MNDKALLGPLNQSERIFLAGAGRSGLALKSFAMRLTQLSKQAFVVGETTTPAITASDLLVIASSSGETTRPSSICGNQVTQVRRLAMEHRYG